MEKKELERRLMNTQQGKCFICEKLIDIKLQNKSVDIDHVIPIKTGGHDDPSNFDLTHFSCNRSKQASDLRVARVLAEFNDIREECIQLNRGLNLNDILMKNGGARYDLNIYIDNNTAKYSFTELGRNEVLTSPIYNDDLSGQAKDAETEIIMALDCVETLMTNYRSVTFGLGLLLLV